MTLTHSKVQRRQFLRTSLATADLRDGGIRMALPEGFQYRSFSVAGDMMSDGNRVPLAHDGMGVFNMSDGTFRLVRNHEDRNSAGNGTTAVDANAYDRRGAGTTTLTVPFPQSRCPTWAVFPTRRRHPHADLRIAERRGAGCARQRGRLAAGSHSPLRGRRRRSVPARRHAGWRIFDVAVNLQTEHEWAGATFAEAPASWNDVKIRATHQPLGSRWDRITLFVNRQGATSGPNPPLGGNEGMTFAIWGPWQNGAL